jgi:hypothetical protein
VEESAESAESVDVQACQQVGVGGWSGHRVEGAGVGDPAVRAVLVVMTLVLAQGVQQVRLGV